MKLIRAHVISSYSSGDVLLHTKCGSLVEPVVTCDGKQFEVTLHRSATFKIVLFILVTCFRLLPSLLSFWSILFVFSECHTESPTITLVVKICQIHANIIWKQSSHANMRKLVSVQWRSERTTLLLLHTWSEAVFHLSDILKGFANPFHEFLEHWTLPKSPATCSLWKQFETTSQTSKSVQKCQKRPKTNKMLRSYLQLNPSARTPKTAHLSLPEFNIKILPLEHCPEAAGRVHSRPLHWLNFQTFDTLQKRNSNQNLANLFIF